LTTAEIGRLVDIIEEQRAEIARLRSGQTLLDVLREIARDPAVPPHIRLKAAEVGVGHETPRLTAAVTVNEHHLGYASRLEQARIDAAMNKRRRELGLTVIEHEPIRPDGQDDSPAPAA
jgi:hypothetical protein